jgi:hypothetical protein
LNNKRQIRDLRRGNHRSSFNARSTFSRTPDNKPGVTIPPWFFWLLGIAAVIGFVIWFFTSAPWLAVRDIRIEGEATDETKAEIEKLRGQNILWLSVTRPEAAIKEHQPAIEEIQILRGIPDTLRVKLIERQPAMMWQAGETWYTVDPSGFVYREQVIPKKEDGSLDFPGTDLPVVVDTRSVPVKITDVIVRLITFVTELKNRLPKEVNLRYVRAEVGETTFNVTIVTDAGWNVLFDTTRSLDVQLKTLAKVLESKRGDVKEYVDVRVRGWVYYK